MSGQSKPRAISAIEVTYFERFYRPGTLRINSRLRSIQAGVDLFLLMNFYSYMHIKGKLYLIQLIALIALLFTFFGLTNPDNIGVGFLLVPVVAIFLIIFSFINFIFLNLSPLDPRKRFLNSFAIGSGFTLLLVLSSVGSLTVYDLLAVVIFVIASTIYIKKNIR